MTNRHRPRAHSNLRSTRSYLSRFQWRKLLQLGPLRGSDVAAWRAVRVAVGVVAPLVVGSATRHLDYGAFASLGALTAGLASFQGLTRGRVTAVAVASVGMAVSTFVGAATAAAAPWVLVPVVIVWGYLAGLAACLGPRLSVAAIQWPVALMIAAGLPLGPREAALRAGLVLAGGMFQGVLVAVSWAFRRGGPERAALAASYRILAAYASQLAIGLFGPPSSIAFPAAAALADPNPLLPTAARLNYLDLLEQAEHIRTSLAALAERAVDDASGSASRSAADAARALDLIADTLSARRVHRAGRVRELGQLLSWWAAVPGTGSRVVGEALLGQLRAVSEDLARLDTMSVRRLEGDGDRTPIVPTMQDEFGWTALTLRANLSPAGETGRHAVRLAVIVGLAELMVQATGLYEGRWVVLTIFLVLKPDYNSTVNLSAQRAIGTAVGAGLGAAAAWLAHPGPAGLITAAGFTIAAAYALFDANYLLYSTFLTAYIVIIMGILGLPADTTAMARLTDTAIGAAFAFIAYSAWPSWEGLAAREKFARLLEAHGEYTTALLHQLAHPGQIDPAQLRALQATARRARTDAEASTARLADEPPHPPLTPTVARTLVAAVTRLAHSELSLHAFVPLPATATDKEVGGIADADAGCLDAVAAAFSTTMSSLVMGLRTLQPPGPLPPLRRLQTALRDHTALDPRLLRITDSLVDAVDTLEDVLRRHLASP